MSLSIGILQFVGIVVLSCTKALSVCDGALNVCVQWVVVFAFGCRIVLMVNEYGRREWSPVIVYCQVVNALLGGDLLDGLL